MITPKRSKRAVIAKLKVGLEKEAIAVKATIMTTPGDTIPARIAASPRINAPTMLMAGPMARGRRNPASLRISKAASIIIISATTGKGTPSRVCCMVSSNEVGKSSGW